MRGASALGELAYHCSFLACSFLAQKFSLSAY